ncbi:MAG: hypothetical protein AAGI01_13830, partial [Myxococcota bacterium]
EADTCAAPSRCCLLQPAYAPRRAAAVCCIRDMRLAELLLSAAAETCASADQVRPMGAAQAVYGLFLSTRS